MERKLSPCATAAIGSGGVDTWERALLYDVLKSSAELDTGFSYRSRIKPQEKSQ